MENNNSTLCSELRTEKGMYILNYYVCDLYIYFVCVCALTRKSFFCIICSFFPPTSTNFWKMAHLQPPPPLQHAPQSVHRRVGCSPLLPVGPHSVGPGRIAGEVQSASQSRTPCFVVWARSKNLLSRGAVLLQTIMVSQNIFISAPKSISATRSFGGRRTALTLLGQSAHLTTPPSAAPQSACL